MSMIIVLILLAYALMLSFLIIGNRKIGKRKTTWANTNPLVSVIVPFRNEEHNIDRLLRELTAQDYDRNNYEILLVDDHSEDNSVKRIENFSATIKLCRLVEEKGKKAALKKGISEANGELILTTDADCSLSQNWISVMVSHYMEGNSDFLVGPVKVEGENHGLQEIEFSALIALTSGAIGIGKAVVCNGANMGFKKSIFEEVQPYESNNHIQSGDDVFFLHGLKRSFPHAGIRFVANEKALVKTRAVEDIRSFISQRVRWARKSIYYRDGDSIMIGLIISAMNFLPLALIATQNWLGLAVVFLIKWLLDTLLILSARKWLGVKKIIHKSFLLSFVYPFYFLLIALLSLLYRPQWKGRRN